MKKRDEEEDLEELVDVGSEYDKIMRSHPADKVKTYKSQMDDLHTRIDSIGENKLKITEKKLRKIIREELKKLPSYDYYEYGLDHVPEKTKGHEAIIGHT